MRRAGHVREIRVNGFSLIEIIVAMAVVAIAFVSFYRLFSQSVTADGVARFYTIAPLLAQEKMAEITGSGASPGINGAGTFDDYPGFRWEIVSTDVVSASLKRAVADMKQVDITISAEDGGITFSLRSYVFLRD